MGAGYDFKCNCCGYRFSTSGPWEFYRNLKGQRKLYGHPSPVSVEAQLHGIYGLSGELYCLRCDKVFDLILVEFQRPAVESFLVWSGSCEPKDEYK